MSEREVRAGSLVVPARLSGAAQRETSAPIAASERLAADFSEPGAGPRQGRGWEVLELSR